MNIYFDNAASTVVRSSAIEAMLAAMAEDYGNPASMHGYGRRAAALLERARGSVADALGSAPECVYFTSGGTEANNLALLGAARGLKRKGKHIITSAMEHSAVAEPIKALEHEGWEVTYLAPDGAGRVPAQSFAEALRDDTVLASVMLVNNDTGAINPVTDYAREIKRRNLGTVLHTDAVQGFCKIPFTVKSLGADLIAVSSHKLHGPKGAGALYASGKVKLTPLIIGGAHEKGKRAGTEPLPAIVGFGEAVRLGFSEIPSVGAAVIGIRDYTIGRLRSDVPDVVFIGEGDSPYILCISLPGFKSEVLMNYLSGEGVFVSKGAACKKGARSPALVAMGLRPDVIDGALRVSFSRYSTLEEADCFVGMLKKATEVLVR